MISEENRILIFTASFIALWFYVFKEKLLKPLPEHEHKIYADEDDDFNRKMKKLDEERSAEQKAWVETQAMWNRGPSFERQHPHVEAAHMTHWLDEIAQDSGEPRFVDQNPLPAKTHQMGTTEKLHFVDNELRRLYRLQRWTKDNIDLWVKSGSDPLHPLMSPMKKILVTANQVQHENQTILEEIDRLESLRDHLRQQMNRRMSY